MATFVPKQRAGIRASLLFSDSCFQLVPSVPVMVLCARFFRRARLNFLVSVVGLLFSLSSVFANGADVRPTTPVRIVSQSVGTDELLLAVATPEQIAALSHLSRSKEFSAISEAAERIPQLPQGAGVEAVLKHNPTIVLFANYSRVELVAQVRRAGVKVIIVERYMALEDTYANLRMIAQAIDADAEKRAEKIIAETQARVAALQKKLKDAQPVRVIAPSTYGLSPGRETTFQDLCDHAGAVNLSALLGGLKGHEPPPVEKMVTWPVDMVVLQGGDNVGDHAISPGEIDAALVPFRKLPPFKYMTAVKEKRVALLKPWHMGCLSHHRVEAYELLARQLHSELFKQ